MIALGCQLSGSSTMQNKLSGTLASPVEPDKVIRAILESIEQAGEGGQLRSDTSSRSQQRCALCL